MTAPRTLSITFGALAPSLKLQLREQDYEIVPEVLDSFQKMADAVTLLAVHGVLPPKPVEIARRRLVTRLGRCIRKRL